MTAASDYGPIGPITTTYGYDAAGNLNLVFYPNGVQHRYSYDALNRLTNLAVAIPSYTDNFGQVHTAATLNNYASRWERQEIARR